MENTDNIRRAIYQEKKNENDIWSVTRSLIYSCHYYQTYFNHHQLKQILSLKHD